MRITYYSSAWRIGLGSFFSGIYLTLLLTTTCSADELSSYAPSVFSYQFNVDSESGNDMFANISFALENQGRVNAGVGNNQQTRNTQDGDFEPVHYFLGYTFEATDYLDIDIEIDHWGENNKVTSDTLGVEFNFYIQGWSLGFSLETIGVDFYPGVKQGCNETHDTFNFDSRAAGVRFGYYGFEHWFFSSTYKKFSYSNDVEQLQRLEENLTNTCNNVNKRENLELYLVNKTWLLNVTDDKQVGIGIGYLFTTETVGLNWYQSQSMLDKSVTYVTSIFISTDVLDDWTFTVSGGWQDAPDQSVIGFLGGGISYYW